ncbi:MAG TPA: inositol monophosphatase family protein [Phototrophicaceae bacterium]|nr:inositol monophosphatase family protein [Phototrophicaceae bacterium]
MDLQTIRRQAEAIAREAGTILMQYYNRPHQETVKGGITDIVTEADPASETLIVARLRAAFPDHHIVTEESGHLGADEDGAAYAWHIDPLDGTVNFANNIPHFAVSMGLAERNGHPLVGVIYNPVADELFSAARGHGVTLNDKPIQVSPITDLQRAILCTGFPYDSAINPNNNLREWMQFIQYTRGLRRFGSAALDLAYVAAGRFDGYWEQRIHSWDCVAGIVCVEEAGGQVSDYHGQHSEKLYSGREVVASNGQIHAAMVDILREAQTLPG